MPTLTLKIPPKGRAVLLCWAGGAGMLLLPLFFSQSARAGGIGGTALAGALLCLWWYSGRYYLSICIKQSTQGITLLRFGYGRMFQKVLYIPCCAIYTIGHYSTPLLRLADCQIFVCHTAKRAFWFLPFARQDLAPLYEWMGAV